MAEPLPGERPVRWGIVATGKISRVFVEELRLNSDSEVVAVGSRSAESASAFAARFGIPNSHSSYEALAEDDSVDVVYVGASHNAHYRAAKAALDAGKAVLCEKPLTVRAEQAEELIGLAADRQVFFMEAMWMRCRPGFADLLTLLRRGDIGEVRDLRADLGFVDTPEQAVRLEDPSQAGGALLDVGVYPITLAYATLGLPAEFHAVADICGGYDRSVAIAMSWPSGVVARLGASIGAALDRSAVFAGSLGKLSIPAPFHEIPALHIDLLDGTGREIDPESKGRGYVHEADEVVRCLRQGLIESPLVPWADSLAIMRILDECRAQIGLEFPEAA
ncbi:MAG: Gfo/Idh/MocA family oxidoreductase, partial [Acidimicrobiales bacterium]